MDRIDGTGQHKWGRMGQDGMGRDAESGPTDTALTSLTGATAERGSQFYGISEGYIFLDNNECSGNESTLLECLNTNADPDVCSHDQDAGVTCQGQLLWIPCYLFHKKSGFI